MCRHHRRRAGADRVRPWHSLRKRRMNQMHGSVARLQSRCKNGSRRWKKLQRSRNVYALRSERRIRDLRHKGTRQAVDFCIAHGMGSLFIGDPHGVRRKHSGRRHNQRVSQWEYGKDSDYLQQKAARAGHRASPDRSGERAPGVRYAGTNTGRRAGTGIAGPAASPGTGIGWDR